MKIYNDNPQGKRVDDCTVRAIAVAPNLYDATLDKLNDI